MEEIGGNGSGLEFENIPEEEEDEVLIPNTKKQRGKNKTYVRIEHFENKINFDNYWSVAEQQKLDLRKILDVDFTAKWDFKNVPCKQVSKII